MGILLETGTGSESSNMGKITTAASTKATAPARRRRARTRKSAALGPLDTEGRTYPEVYAALHYLFWKTVPLIQTP